MTVNTTNITSGPYAGNGVTTQFSYTFRIETKNQLLVYETAQDGSVTALAVDTDYTVSGIGDDNGGIVTRTAGALPTGYTWYIRSNYQQIQATDFDSQGGFFPDVHEAALDKLTFLIQQLDDVQNRRSLLFDDSLSRAPSQNALPSPEANKALLWDVDGSLVNSDLGSGDNDDLDRYDSMATFITASPIGDAVYVTSYYGGWAGTVAGPKGGHYRYRTGATNAAPSAGTAVSVSSIGGGDGTGSTTGQSAQAGLCWDASGVEWRVAKQDVYSLDKFGLIEGDSADATLNATRLLDAITFIRRDSNSILQHIGDVSNITAYSSGVIVVPGGVWRIDPDAIELINDFNLSLVGCGSKRFSNYLRGQSVLLFPGSSSGYCIKTNGAGARGLTLRDLSICYSDNTFTGDVIDNLDSPGLTIDRCFIGTYGNTAGNRYQTANSLIRLTYDEFTKITNSTLDGAVDGIWADDTRAVNGSTFGGFSLQVENVAFYDFVGDMIKIPGNRTRETLKLKGVALNPISVDCATCLNISNVNGLSVDTCELTPSTVNKPTSEYMTLNNVTGSIKNSVFNALSKTGTISNPNTNIEISGNTFSGTDGITVEGGTVRAHSNKWQGSGNAWTITPTDETMIDIGPEQCKNTISNYISISDSANLSGRIEYHAEKDSSTGRVINSSSRVTWENKDRKSFVVSDVTYTALAQNTGRTHKLSSSSSQTITLPSAATNVGIKLTFTDVVGGAGKTCTVNRDGTDSIYDGSTGANNSLAVTNALGARITLECISTTEWLVVESSGSWT